MSQTEGQTFLLDEEPLRAISSGVLGCLGDHLSPMKVNKYHDIWRPRVPFFFVIPVKVMEKGIYTDLIG